jgi:hypothetical protein
MKFIMKHGLGMWHLLIREFDTKLIQSPKAQDGHWLYFTKWRDVS